MDMRSGRIGDLEHLHAEAELDAAERPAEGSVAVEVSVWNLVLAAQLGEKGVSRRRGPGGRQRYQCHRPEGHDGPHRAEDPHVTSVHRFPSCWIGLGLTPRSTRFRAARFTATPRLGEILRGRWRVASPTRRPSGCGSPAGRSCCPGRASPTWRSRAWSRSSAGIVAGSIALIGFGIDSAIEGFASVIIVWRFTGSRMLSEAAERRAQKLVAIQFFILAPYVGVEAIRALIEGHHAEESWSGSRSPPAASSSCLCWAGRSSGSGARSARRQRPSEGKQNLLCAYLAGALLIGLLGNALFGRGGSTRRSRC